jgi:hypothetical protein
MVRDAIVGMLPKNKLRARRAKLRIACGGFGSARRAEASGNRPVLVKC